MLNGAHHGRWCRHQCKPTSPVVKIPNAFCLAGLVNYSIPGTVLVQPGQRAALYLIVANGTQINRAGSPTGTNVVAFGNNVTAAPLQACLD